MDKILEFFQERSGKYSMNRFLLWGSTSLVLAIWSFVTIISIKTFLSSRLNTPVTTIPMPDIPTNILYLIGIFSANHAVTKFNETASVIPPVINSTVSAPVVTTTTTVTPIEPPLPPIMPG